MYVYVYFYFVLNIKNYLLSLCFSWMKIQTSKNQLQETRATSSFSAARKMPHCKYSTRFYHIMVLEVQFCS